MFLLYEIQAQAHQTKNSYLISNLPIEIIYEYFKNNLNCFRNICPGVSLPAQNVTELFCPQDPQVASINNDNWIVQKMIIMNNKNWFVQKIIIMNNRNNNYNCPKNNE